MRKTAAVVGGLSLGMLTAWVLATGPATCSPDEDGCRFTDGHVTWQTHEGVTWPVCPEEDSDGPCLWDASRDGNGEGHSFVVGTDGTVTYWQ